MFNGTKKTLSIFIAYWFAPFTNNNPIKSFNGPYKLKRRRAIINKNDFQKLFSAVPVFTILLENFQRNYYYSHLKRWTNIHLKRKNYYHI